MAKVKVTNNNFIEKYLNNSSEEDRYEKELIDIDRIDDMDLRDFYENNALPYSDEFFIAPIPREKKEKFIEKKFSKQIMLDIEKIKEDNLGFDEFEFYRGIKEELTKIFKDSIIIIQEHKEQKGSKYEEHHAHISIASDMSIHPNVLYSVVNKLITKDKIMNKSLKLENISEVMYKLTDKGRKELLKTPQENFSMIKQDKNTGATVLDPYFNGLNPTDRPWNIAQGIVKIGAKGSAFKGKLGIKLEFDQKNSEYVDVDKEFEAIKSNFQNVFIQSFLKDTKSLNISEFKTELLNMSIEQVDNSIEIKFNNLLQYGEKFIHITNKYLATKIDEIIKESLGEELLEEIDFQDTNVEKFNVKVNKETFVSNIQGESETNKTETKQDTEEKIETETKPVIKKEEIKPLPQQKTISHLLIDKNEELIEIETLLSTKFISSNEIVKREFLKKKGEIEAELINLKNIELSQENEMLEKTVQEKEESIVTLTDTVQQKEEIIVQKEQEIVQIIEVKEREKNELNEVIKTKESIIVEKESNINELEGVKRVLEEDNKTLNGILSRKQEENDTLTEQVNISTKTIESKNKTISAMEDNYKNLEKDYNNKSIELDSTKEQLNNKSKDLENEKIKSKTTETKLRQVEKEKETLGLLAQQKDKLNNELKTTLSQLKEKLDLQNEDISKIKQSFEMDILDALEIRVDERELTDFGKKVRKIILSKTKGIVTVEQQGFDNLKRSIKKDTTNKFEQIAMKHSNYDDAFKELKPLFDKANAIINKTAEMKDGDFELVVQFNEYVEKAEKYIHDLQRSEDAKLEQRRKDRKDIGRK